MFNSNNYVIGICSPSGGGKTTLVKKLADQIEESVIICFDDYGDPFWDIANFDDWIKDGAHLNEINTPQLAVDLKNLKNGKSIVSPKDHNVIEPKNIILFDTLVGRSHVDTGSIIDYLVYIDVPLELALARRLTRNLSELKVGNLDLETTQDKLENINEYLEAYSSRSGPRQIYSAIQDQVKPFSDLVLDGEQDPKF